MEGYISVKYLIIELYSSLFFFLVAVSTRVNTMEMILLQKRIEKNCVSHRFSPEWGAGEENEELLRCQSCSSKLHGCSLRLKDFYSWSIFVIDFDDCYGTY